MKKNEQMLLSCLKQAERMSGFDSYDEGDFDDFDGDEMNYFDGDDMSYATGPSAKNYVTSDPYIIEYTNGIAADVDAYIFGYNDFAGSTNFGNVATTTITNLDGGTYARMFNQSNNKPFVIGEWRFESSTPSQLRVTLQLWHVDASGKEIKTPFNIGLRKDNYQQQSDSVDAVKAFTVDGNSYIKFTLKASAVLTISMFPVKIMSAKARLNGGKTFNQARAPRLSGKNVAPVIIQTSQQVQGIESK